MFSNFIGTASVILALLVPSRTLAAPQVLDTDITSDPNTGGENNCGA